MKFLSIFFATISLAAAAGAGWRTTLVDYLSRPAVSGIAVGSPSLGSGKVKVKVTNDGNEVVKYSGYSSTLPQLFWEKKKEKEWVDDGWMWCGTGISEFQLKAGSSIEFEIDVQPGMRYFTFFDSLDGKRSSLVLLFQNEE